jgi:hypothetical protein
MEIDQACCSCAENVMPSLVASCWPCALCEHRTIVKAKLFDVHEKLVPPLARVGRKISRKSCTNSTVKSQLPVAWTPMTNPKTIGPGSIFYRQAPFSATMPPSCTAKEYT